MIDIWNYMDIVYREHGCCINDLYMDIIQNQIYNTFDTWMICIYIYDVYIYIYIYIYIYVYI